MKKYRSRKKKALLRALALAALVAALTLTNAMNFLPRQALRDIADTQNVTEPEVIRSFCDNKLKVYRSARQYLVEGREGLMLCAVGFDPLMGWYDRDWCTVGTNDGNGIHIGYRGHQQGEAYSGYFFGRLDDEAIASVKLRWRDGEEDRWYEETLDKEAFFRGENGKRYILWESPFQREEATQWLWHLTAYAYDAENGLLAEEEVHWQSWGSSDK